MDINGQGQDARRREEPNCDEALQENRMAVLLEFLIGERSDLLGMQIPEGMQDRRRLLRALFNTRPPDSVPDDVLHVQDEYLKARIAEMGITRFEDIPQAPTCENGQAAASSASSVAADNGAHASATRPCLKLWRGDITTLECDAIVNAANSGMTGCWSPNHMCIDNAIHTFAGMQLRAECTAMMERQGHSELVGQAKITRAYNLPSLHVIHTVGPQVPGCPTRSDCEALASCYRSCYRLALDNGLSNIAFCCISTGVFGFPKKEAAQIAVETVCAEQRLHPHPLEVCFVLFGDEDERIYHGIFEKLR